MKSQQIYSYDIHEMHNDAALIGIYNVQTGYPSSYYCRTDSAYNLYNMCLVLPNNIQIIQMRYDQYIECHNAIKECLRVRKINNVNTAISVYIMNIYTRNSQVNKLRKFRDSFYTMMYKSKLLEWMWRARERMAKQWSTPEKLQEFIDEHSGEELEKVLDEWEVVVRSKLPWMGEL